MDGKIKNKTTAGEPKTCTLGAPLTVPGFYEKTESKPGNAPKKKKKPAQKNEKQKCQSAKGKKKSNGLPPTTAERMFWELIDAGVPFHRALRSIRIECKKAKSNGPQKQSKTTGKQNAVSKKKTKPTEKTKKQTKKKTSVQENKRPSGVEVAILHENHPHVNLDDKQIQLIQDDLLKKIQAQKTDTIKPAFYGITTKFGYLVLNCVNKPTAHWIASLEKKIIPWEGAQLKVIEAVHLSKRYTVKMTFPNSKSDPVGNIFNLLEAQNMELRTNRWKVVERTDSDQDTDLKFSLDYLSAEELKKHINGLNYKWGQIKFTLEEETPQTPSLTINNISVKSEKPS